MAGSWHSDSGARLKALHDEIVANLTRELQDHLAQHHRIADQVRKLKEQVCGKPIEG